jgi:hypothetical protein
MKKNKHLALLGLQVMDRVTKFSGVVTAISFDLYGCIGAMVDPGLDEGGQFKAPHWFEVSRITPSSCLPVMQPPDYEEDRPAE